MKIIHVADLHIDSKMETNLDQAKAGERRVELLQTFERMVEYAAANGVRVILIAGDLFDKPHIRKNARRRIIEQVNEHPGIDFVYLKGNHDKNDLFSDLDTGEIPNNFKTFGSDAWKSYTYGNVVITGREITDENSKTLSANLVLDQADFNIVTLHGQEVNYKGRDRTNVINIPDFKNKNIDYLALGHVHTYKCERLDERGEYCYAGCLEGRGFDECGKKGFVLLEIDENGNKFNHEFISFARRELHEISVLVSEDMNMPSVIQAIRGALRGIPEDDLIKVVLTGQTELDFDIDCERISHIFEPAFYFFKVYDKTETRIDYDSFINDKSLKGEFVRLMQEQDMGEDERAEIIELGMKAIMGEEII